MKERTPRTVSRDAPTSLMGFDESLIEFHRMNCRWDRNDRQSTSGYHRCQPSRTVRLDRAAIMGVQRERARIDAATSTSRKPP